MAQNTNPQTILLTVDADPRSALDTAIEAARIASPVISGPDGRTWAALPDRIKLHDISDPNRLPSRVRQTVIDMISGYQGGSGDSKEAAGVGAGGSSLTVSGLATVAAVPEPSTWAMALAGLVAVGSLARRRSAARRG